MPFTLAIVGRPNVGKSTLFNRLVGRRLALVDDQPGVTRDLREGEARLGPLRFTVLDTAGIEDADEDSLTGRMRKLTERAVAAADAVLFLIDARAGLTAGDRDLAAMLRRSAARVILAANKAEGTAGAGGLAEAWELGLGEPLALSAEHGEGMSDLVATLAPLIAAAVDRGANATESEPQTDLDLPAELPEGADDAARESWRPTERRPLQIAVIGRPNAGKSTLVNRIIGEERLLTGPEAGITRDAISIPFDWDGLPVRLFDTAGLRRKSRVQARLERLSVADALRAIRFSEVVVLLLDAEIPFEQQDLRLADLAEREGRAVVIAVNKWDLEPDRQRRLEELKETFARLLPQLAGAPLVTVSALTGQGIDRLRAAIVAVHATWNRRVPTARLNQWLAAMAEAHPPPAPRGRRIRLRYITQAKTRPPGFVLMCSRPEELPASYRRYLVNGLRSAFDLPGVPVRLWVRRSAGDNPFAGRRPPARSALRKHLGRPDPT